MKKGLILLVSILCLLSVVAFNASLAVADTKSDNLATIESAKQSVAKVTGLAIGESYSLKPLSRSEIELIFLADGKSIALRFYVKSGGEIDYRGEYRVF